MMFVCGCRSAMRAKALKAGEPPRIGAKTIRPFVKLSGNGPDGRSASPPIADDYLEVSQ
jgi:hypothetical protein